MSRRPLLFALAFAAAPGCSDYHLKAWGEDARPADDPEDTAAPDTGDGELLPPWRDHFDDFEGKGDVSLPPRDDDPPEDDPPEDDPPEELDCSDAEMTDASTWIWYGSMPFSTEADLTASAGRPFYDPSYELRDYSTVSLPDSGHIPSGYDKVYIADFSLAAVPGSFWFSVQSDDGLWLWVNGDYIGHWGGDWQEEGCVNDRADCLETVEVSPIDITAHLVAGQNTIAARVSNAVNNTYFDLVNACTDQ